MTMPDIVTPEEMHDFGYTWDGMLPVSVERALELDALGVPIFLLYEDETEAFSEDRDEISRHEGMLGVQKDDWEAYLNEQRNVQKMSGL